MRDGSRRHAAEIDAIAHLFYYTGLSGIASRMCARRGRFALLFHGVGARRLPGVHHDAQPHLTRVELDSLLHWVAARFDFLTPDEYLAGDRPGVLLTFDDGLANNYRRALPVLRGLGAPAVFFVTTQHVADPRDWLFFIKESATKAWGGIERVPAEYASDWYDGMSIDELRECAADPLITIGSHGVTHVDLAGCDRDALARELRDSKGFLEQVTGKPVEYFAYPRGVYDKLVIEETRRARYSAAFVIDSRQLADHRFEIPRVGIYQADAPYLALKLSGLHRRPMEVICSPGPPQR